MKYYTKEHEWLEIDGDTAVVGISVHAADELGDITYVELPETGAEYSVGDVFSVVESVKAASDIYSPLAGSVIEVNEELEDSPELVNEDAEGKGWICKFNAANIDTSSFMTAEQYKAFLAG
ncbi:MAG: glycine cleavage system protein GcvH [Lentisphaeraceae bacterium]|nr:glycine cleavage system protein GcvH [Lentisphaeraceae bacterium]